MRAFNASKLQRTTGVNHEISDREIKFKTRLKLARSNYLLFTFLPIFDFHLCGICRGLCHYKFDTVLRKSCIVFYVKPRERKPN